jgi:pimeloyl-ACP methyl ester carboxylesterase
MTNDFESDWEHNEAIINGIRLHWVQAGEGPLVVLLHGFPEFWYSWRHQIPVLSTRFRVVAPDMRGYNLSEKPHFGYDIETLTADVRALIRSLGEEKAIIIGHDWGGVIAWAFAARFPDATEKLVIMNAPHPGRFQRSLTSGLGQMLRSSYVLFFQIPRLPELLLGANRCWALARVMRRSAKHADAFSDEDLERYRDAMSRPGALTAALGYYRAIFRTRRQTQQLGDVQAATLLLWGEEDRALGRELTEGLEQWVPNLTVHFLECGHWTQQELPNEVNRYLVEFL